MDDGRRGAGPPGLVTIGPRTTLHALLTAYPFLSPQLIVWDKAFAPLADARRASGWARVTSVGDIAVTMDVSWRLVVRDLRRHIAAELGEAPPPAGSDALPPAGDKRLTELRAIAGELEEGGSLLELAARVRGLTAGLTAADAEALDRALANDAERARSDGGALLSCAEEAPRAEAPPAGHPLETQQRAGRQARLLADDLGAELRRIGGSPSRRRWAAAKPMVQRLIARLSEVEAMFRRHRQAWFPALAVHGIDGPGALLAGREAMALELLRRLRLAVDRDDAAFVADAGGRLLEIVEDVLNTIDLVVVPLAGRHLSESDWRAVRELEDAAGYGLIAAPPPWPGEP